MTIPTEIIEKAISGGWILPTPNFAPHPDDSTHIEWDSSAQIVLDPEFWKCLGKSLGWRESVDRNITVYGDWKSNAHKFYDLILDGQPTDKFFQEILTQVN